jgi:hypothetical protein
MKIFVTYSNTPNCLEFGNKMHDKFLEQKDKYIPMLGGKKNYNGNNEFLKSLDGDDTFNNISVLNPYINEHTIIYWAGNNLDKIYTDYIGFCHYRRLFDIPDNEQPDENTIYVNEMQFGISNALYFLINHDPNTVRNFSEFIQKFIRTNDKHVVNQFVNFLNSNLLFSANMFIMHKNLFKEYMKIINPIYNIIFNMITPFPNVNDRSYGFILERLNSFVIYKLIADNKNIKFKQGKYVKLGDILT